MAAKTRNIIAIAAIALTTILFTSLFTVAMSMNKSFEEANFRQAGGYCHGTYKYLTREKLDELKTDPLIKQYGIRKPIGMAIDDVFSKSQVEVSYSDENTAHWMYCDPIEGRFPTEGTKEAATDLRVLELLGVEPVLGNEFTITTDVDGKMVTETFVLCGYWNYDEVSLSNHVLLPKSRADEICVKAGIEGKEEGDTTKKANSNWCGALFLNVMFKNSMNIEKDMNQVLTNHRYQSESPSTGDDYIAIGVNWGYMGAQLSDSMDPMTVMAIIGLLTIITFTGYLIVYNVFQISVSGDIRFYGLLKTIGTTGRQLKRMIRIQALFLSCVGIPLGILAGYGIGIKLTPVILSRLDGVYVSTISVNPFIFIGSAVFSLLTVILSCRRPGQMAAKVSPVEAVRYTEGGSSKKKTRKAKQGASLPKMAWANLGRSKSKTSVTIISLSLAVVLLNMTVIFTKGFDMDKYLEKNVAADFIVSDASYFRSSAGWYEDKKMPEAVVSMLEGREGIENGGRVYGQTFTAQEFVTEAYARKGYGRWFSQKELDQVINQMERNENDLLSDKVQLYGMEEGIIDRLKVLEGDLSKVKEPNGNYIAAVYLEDDYNNPHMDSHWAKVGDKITIRYVEEFEYYNPSSGEILDPELLSENGDFAVRAKKYADKEYEVAALVVVPHSISYRFYGADQFVLNDQTFIRDTGTDAVLYYAFDMAEEHTQETEAFLSDFTNKQMTQFDYESKASYVAEFESFRNMFLMLGGVLSFIVGVVGILNFFNAILTGILTRRRELAVLQSIGMTGKQLKVMLIWEGLYYSLGAIAAALLINLAIGPLLSDLLSGMFWFFTYRFTVIPIMMILPVFVALGVTLPLIIYRFVSRQSIVERLRVCEN